MLLSMRCLIDWLIFFRFMIYDRETGIAHESVSTYFQCGPFYWGSSPERWSPNTLRVVTARVYYVLRGSLRPSPIYFSSIQWKPQRLLTWSATHDFVSWLINPWKSFDFLMESNLWPLAQSTRYLTARPPELSPNDSCCRIGDVGGTCCSISPKRFFLIISVQ